MAIKKFLLPLLAALGIGFSLFVVVYTSRRPPPPAIPYAPPVSPYEYSIAGSGVIEAVSENISIGTPFDEVVEKVFVQAGDQVKKGDVLFRLNTETLEQKKLEALFQLEASKVLLLDERARFSLYERLTDKRAVSENAYNTQLYAVLEAEANVQKAEKALAVIETNIERSSIQAPMDGEVLQVNIRVGENADRNPFRQNSSSLMVFGSVDYFHIRISIDESDVWRYQEGSQGCAFVRGNSSIKIPLEFVRIEPYIVPKQSLTGSDFERVDTRVLQVIYRFKKKNYPVYIGEIMDIYLESFEGEGKFG